MTLILPVCIILGLCVLIGRLIIFLFDTISDMRERHLIPEPVKVVRAALAVSLIGVLIMLGWTMLRLLPTLE